MARLLSSNFLPMGLLKLKFQSLGNWLTFARHQCPKHLKRCNVLQQLSFGRRYPSAFLMAATAQCLTCTSMYALCTSPRSDMNLVLKTASSLNVLRKTRSHPRRREMILSLRIHALSVGTLALSHGDRLMFGKAWRMLCIGQMIAAWSVCQEALE